MRFKTHSRCGRHQHAATREPGAAARLYKGHVGPFRRASVTREKLARQQLLLSITPENANLPCLWDLGGPHRSIIHL